MNVLLLVVAAGAGRLPGLSGYYSYYKLETPYVPSSRLSTDDGGILFGFGYQPFVHLSDFVKDGAGWMASYGWGMGGRSAAVIVSYEQSEHEEIETGETAIYWRLTAGYGGYLTEKPRFAAPYFSIGLSMHSVEWGDAEDEGRGGYGGYAGMGVDFLPSEHLFFGFDAACHLWSDSEDNGFLTITATASVFLEF